MSFCPPETGRWSQSSLDRVMKGEMGGAREGTTSPVKGGSSTYPAPLAPKPPSSRRSQRGGSPEWVWGLRGGGAATGRVRPKALLGVTGLRHRSSPELRCACQALGSFSVSPCSLLLSLAKRPRPTPMKEIPLLKALSTYVSAKIPFWTTLNTPMSRACPLAPPAHPLTDPKGSWGSLDTGGMQLD